LVDAAIHLDFALLDREGPPPLDNFAGNALGLDNDERDDYADPINDNEDEEIRNLLQEINMNTIIQPSTHSDNPFKDNALSIIAKAEYFEGAAKVYGRGTTFMEKFADDEYAWERATYQNVYYPLRSYEEWEFTNVLMRMRCSLAEKTDLLNTALVGNHGNNLCHSLIMGYYRSGTLICHIARHIWLESALICYPQDRNGPCKG
jgi:hypothetical protein